MLSVVSCVVCSVVLYYDVMLYYMLNVSSVMCCCHVVCVVLCDVV